ncbi:macro domain-containing protein, partial [Chromobacterium vaccinii]
GEGEPELLAACYRNSLELAARHGVASIAFPAISCGVYGYPLEAACVLAIGELRAWLSGRPHGLREVRLVAFDARALDAYRRALS